MKTAITILLASVFLFACSRSGVSDSQEEEAKQLEVQLNEIEKIAAPVPCTDPSEWKFTAIGAKACGGPAAYIAYHESIDEAAFLAKVEAYTNAQREFNKKWNIKSDSAITPEPSGVTCENGKPKLIYSNLNK